MEKLDSSAYFRPAPHFNNMIVSVFPRSVYAADKGPEFWEEYERGYNAKKELRRIHAEEICQTEKFYVERNKWKDEHEHKFTDKNQYFQERCKWELDFKEKHFKPIHDKIASTAKYVRAFWCDTLLGQMHALLGLKTIVGKITKHDYKALISLERVESERTSNFKGFKLMFTFGENHYFKNRVLTKTYEVVGDNNDSVFLVAFGDKIEWKDEHRLTENKRGKRRESFFHFFDSYAMSTPLSFDIETDKLKGNYPDDYKIGIRIRDKIIPHAASCFLGKVTDDDSEDCDDDAEDSDDTIDDDSEGIEDDVVGMKFGSHWLYSDYEESGDDSEGKGVDQDQGEDADKKHRKRVRGCDDDEARKKGNNIPGQENSSYQKGGRDGLTIKKKKKTS